MSNYIEIDLKDLFKDVCSKWKTVVIGALIFALLGGLFGFYQMKKPKESPEDIIKSMTENMTQEEILNVENSAKVINSYRDLYEKQKEYNDNSILQNLNPFDLNSLVLSFYVDNYYKISYPVIEESNNIVPLTQAYISAISDDAFFGSLAKENGISNSLYVKELIFVNDINKDSGVFKVTIYADTDTLLEGIGNYVKKTVEEKQADITEIYGQHNIKLTDETRIKAVNSSIAELQSQNISRLTTLSTSMANEEKLFSGDQLSYLKFLVHEQKEEDGSIVKNVIVGIIIGAFIAVVYLVFRYLVSGTFKTESEVAAALHTESFGKIDLGCDFLASRINAASEKQNFKKVAVVCNESDERINELLPLLKTDSECLVDILNNKQSFESLASCDAAVLVEELKHSKRSNVFDKKKMCESIGVKLLGVVLK